MLRASLLACLVACACGGASDEASSGAGGAGTTGAGAATSAGSGPSDVGLGKWICQPGELALGDGSCRPAGIVPGECGMGFTHDGKDGCEPNLPAAPCPAGTLAIPGETSCHAVAACGAGKWDGIPTAVGTQFVDASYAGASDGTAAKPHKTIAAAVSAASPGAVIAIAPGSYAEALTIAKPLALWGKCPGEVTIAPAAGDAVVFVEGADKSELHHVAVSGTGVGVKAWGATGVVIDGVWVHDTGYIGVVVDRDQGGSADASALVTHSLVEGAGLIGIGGNASITVQESLVRDTKLGGDGDWGVGIEAFGILGATPATLEVRRSLVERTHNFAIGSSGHVAVVEDSVVRDVAPCTKPPGVIGIASWAQPNAPTSLTVRGSMVEKVTRPFAPDVISHGIYVLSSTLAVERSVVRHVGAADLGGGIVLVGTSADPPLIGSVKRSTVSDVTSFGVVSYMRGAFTVESVSIRGMHAAPGGKFGGRGIDAERVVKGMGATLDVRGSRIEDVAGMGLGVLGVDAVVDGLLVKHVTPFGTHSAAVMAQPVFELDLQPAQLTLSNSEVGDASPLGIKVLGSNATITSTHVHDVTNSTVSIGVGVAVAIGSPGDTPSNATLSHLLVERCRDVGILAFNGKAVVDHTLVRDVKQGLGIGFGDGIDAITMPDYGGRGDLTLSDTRVESLERVGIGTFGGDVRIGTTRVECAPIDLDGETNNDIPFKFQDDGGNVCGCKDALRACKAKSSDLTTPKF